MGRHSRGEAVREWLDWRTQQLPEGVEHSGGFDRRLGRVGAESTQVDEKHRIEPWRVVFAWCPTESPLARLARHSVGGVRLVRQPPFVR